MQSGNTNRTSVLNTILLSAVLAVSIVSPASAGDEDMNPTAYQQFDPVTGYMIPIENPPQGQQNHGATASTPPSGQDQSVTGATTATPTGTESTAAGQSESSPSFWVYLLAGIVIIGGLAAWVRRGTRHQPGNLD